MLSRASQSVCRARLPAARRVYRAFTTLPPTTEIADSASPHAASNDSTKAQINFELNARRLAEAVSEERLDSTPEILEDSPFMNIPPLEDPLLQLFTGMIMEHGHRQKASRQVARTLLHIHTLTGAAPLPVLRDGLFAIAPLAAVKRVATSALKHIMQPHPLSEKRSLRYAVQWLIEECEHPGPLPLEERFAREIIDIHNGTSKLLKKREDFHTAAMLNKAHVTHRLRR
ncbi:ribosomal protein S7 domain-containing protein [Mucidula mucida]|nr:ribosomal protein S7 domain-containing protein [Mucidula mucida]